MQTVVILIHLMIVLAMVAGALRQLALRYDGHADAPLIAGVPVSYNTSPERLAGNEFTYITPSLLLLGWRR